MKELKVLSWFFKRFIKKQNGMGTVEIVIIIAVLVGIALIFRKVITEYMTVILKTFFQTGQDASQNQIDEAVNNIIKATPTMH